MQRDVMVLYGWVIRSSFERTWPGGRAPVLAEAVTGVGPLNLASREPLDPVKKSWRCETHCAE